MKRFEWHRRVHVPGLNPAKQGAVLSPLLLMALKLRPCGHLPLKEVGSMPLHRVAPHQKDQYHSEGLQGVHNCTLQAVHFIHNLL